MSRTFVSGPAVRYILHPFLISPDLFLNSWFRFEKDLSWSLEQVIWTLLFSIIIVISILGNTLVLWIILAHKTMWSVPNYFLLNLTIADLLMAALNCVPRFFYQTKQASNRCGQNFTNYYEQKFLIFSAFCL